MDAGAITSAFNRCTLPLRTSTLPTGYSSRCTAFGTCALVVLKVSNQPPQMILNVRSATLAETAGLDHVIPAGTFQPMQDDRFLDREFSLTENLVREFAEELFNDAGISGHEAKRLVLASLDDLYGPVGKEFRAKIIHQNRYKLLYLGTVIDPVNLKPEALTVFLLHQGYLMSVSGLDLEPSPETDESGIQPHEFSEERLDSLISSSNMVPTGKAHLMLVKKHFSYLMSELASI